MTVSRLLERLRERRVEVTAEGGDLRVRAPRGVITPSDLAALREGKEEIISLLEGEARERHASRSRLSHQQKRIWYLDRVEGGLPAYNLSGAFVLEGPLDVAVLEGALHAFVERHPVLRSYVGEEGGLPRPLRDPVAPIQLIRQEVQDVAGAEDEEGLRRWLEEEADRVLPLDEPPLIRLTLIRRGAASHLLLVVVHHLIWDGWSFDLFLRDVGELYAAAREGREPVLPILTAGFEDFVEWQHGRLAGARLPQATAYWDGVLTPPPPSLDLPTDMRRPPLMTYGGARIPIRLEGPLLQGARELARKERATLFLVLFAAFKALLGRYSGQEDLVVATPVNGRLLPEFEDLVGLFVNTLPVRSEAGRDLPFLEYLQQVRGRFLSAMEFQDTPFEWLVQRHAERDPSRSPLFQAVFSFQRTSERCGRWGELMVRSFPRGTRSTYTDVNLWIREYEGYLDGGLDYRTDLLEQSTVEGMVVAFQRLLEGAVKNPSSPLKDLPLLSPAEVERETVARAGPSLDGAGERVYLDSVRSRVQADPERPSILRPREAPLTLRELWEASGRIAGALGECGIGAGAVVGVMVQRTHWLPALIVGVHRAGAVYLPLDPELPHHRIDYMLRDSGAGLILHDSNGALPGPGSDAVGSDVPITLRLEDALSSSAPPSLGEGTVGPRDLAYLMYTSGSTGRPKAVAVEHGALSNHLASMTELLGEGEDERWVAVTTISFDISLLELLLPIYGGGQVAVAGEHAARSPAALTALLAETRATRMQATPAVWQMLLTDNWRGKLSRVLCGGQALSRELADRLLQVGDEVWNLYGPTEATIWCSAERVVEGSGSVPIGRPIHNTCLYVLDENHRPVPSGVRGEIWIGGAGIARGYHGRPELTSERFVEDPFCAGAGRMYRSGDWGRWRGDGRLEYLGRLDDQVKLHGFRIEPGEVESALEEMEEVGQAVVALRGDRLVGYVRFEPGERLLGSEIRARLARKLPRYMIPGLVVELDRIPLTPNGKLDRPALPDPLDRTGPERRFEEAVGEAEEAYAEVWTQLLAIPRVGRNDNFFELGGTSLQSIQAVVAMERRTGRKVDPRALFFQSLAQLAAN